MSGHVYLVGFMGSGKSTVGVILSERLGMPFVDLDDRVVEAEGRTIPKIFSAKGEDAFRAAEGRALRIVAGEDPSVVACGGGVVLDPENRRVLSASGTVVYLDVDAPEVLSRVGDGPERPLLSRDRDPDQVAALIDARSLAYEDAADIVVDTRGKAPSLVAEEILAAIGSDS